MRRCDRTSADDLVVAELGPLQQCAAAFAAIRREAAEALLLGVDRFALGIERRPALVVDKTELAALRRKPQIGIVLAQSQAVLGAAREHAIRLDTPRVIRSSTSTPR